MTSEDSRYIIDIIYNAEEALKGGRLLLKKGDCLQAYEKGWASASYALVKFFLTIGVQLSSHPAKKVANSVLVNEARALGILVDGKHASIILRNSWISAEKCHSSFCHFECKSDPEIVNALFESIELYNTTIESLSTHEEFKNKVLQGIKQRCNGGNSETFKNQQTMMLGKENFSYDLEMK